MNEEPIHPVVSEIKSLIEENSMAFEYMEHAPVRTSEEAAKLRPEYTLSQGAKALIVRIKKRAGGGKFFAMFIVPGDIKFDIKKAKELFNAKDIRFATEDEVSEITNGVKVGGVPPFGNLFGLEVYADSKVLDNDKIIFNAGDKRVSIAIDPADYAKLVSPEVVEIT